MAVAKDWGLGDLIPVQLRASHLHRVGLVGGWVCEGEGGCCLLRKGEVQGGQVAGCTVSPCNDCQPGLDCWPHAAMHFPLLYEIPT